MVFHYLPPKPPNAKPQTPKTPRTLACLFPGRGLGWNNARIWGPWFGWQWFGKMLVDGANGFGQPKAISIIDELAKSILLNPSVKIPTI
jgi:hypothetical protein